MKLKDDKRRLIIKGKEGKDYRIYIIDIGIPNLCRTIDVCFFRNCQSTRLISAHPGRPLTVSSKICSINRGAISNWFRAAPVRVRPGVS